MLTGTPVSLQQMLDCRERRQDIQNKYLSHFHGTVISFCMNIPGDIKTTPAIRKLFDEGKEAILNCLNDLHTDILEQVELHQDTGDEFILCVAGEAALIKRTMTEIEELHPLGRLFDIDVINSNGTKLARPVLRTCILCQCPAHECARSRKHTIQELQDTIELMLNRYEKASRH